MSIAIYKQKTIKRIGKRNPKKFSKKKEKVKVYPLKSYATKTLHNNRDYSSKIVLKTTLQKSYINRKNYKYRKWLGKTN